MGDTRDVRELVGGPSAPGSGAVRWYACERRRDGRERRLPDQPRDGFASIRAATDWLVERGYLLRLGDGLVGDIDVLCVGLPGPDGLVPATPGAEYAAVADWSGAPYRAAAAFLERMAPTRPHAERREFQAAARELRGGQAS